MNPFVSAIFLLGATPSGWAAKAACAVLAALLCLSGVTGAASTPKEHSAETIRRIEIKVDPGAFRGPGTWPLGAGAPLPKGKMKSVDALRLRSEKRGAIPVQIQVRIFDC